MGHASAGASVRVALGALLLATAGLKLYGLGVSSVPQVGWFSQLWVQLLAAEWELVLGGWLLSGARPRLSWLAALVTFVCFAGVSGYLGWVGVASCGCFGAVRTSPWWAFGVDICALPASGSQCEPGWCLSRDELIWIVVVGLPLLGLLAFGISYAGSPAAALACLRSDSLSIANPYVDCGKSLLEGRPLVSVGQSLQFGRRVLHARGRVSNARSASVLRSAPLGSPGRSVVCGRYPGH